MYKIMILEDDASIAGVLEKHLRSWDMQVYTASDFQNVLREFAAYSPQLVLLDITLPFFNGYYWCSEIRRISKVPIIFISSASDNMNVVMAMNMGADDFISKPFDLNVLTAKIRALLRRTYDFTSAADYLEGHDIILNLAEAKAVYKNIPIELTKNEYRILQILLENKGKIVSRDRLMQRLWETDTFVDENTLTVNVTRLRKKLDGVGAENIITTKKGMGYIIE